MPWANVYADAYNPYCYLKLEKSKVEQRSGSPTVRQDSISYHGLPSYLCFLYQEEDDPDNHDGVITHLQPDIFQILKDDAVKVLNSICQQIWKTQQ